MKKQSLATLIVIIVVVLGIGIWVTMALRTHSSSAGSVADLPKTALTSFAVQKPNFVAYGLGLSHVDVYAVPAGANLNESDIKKIGTAVKQGADAKGELWVLPIPKDPIQATDIYATGYDVLGNPVGTISLGIEGATNINNEIWGTEPITAKPQTENGPTDAASNDEHTLAIGQSTTFGSLKITLKSVDGDSRCPAKVQCIQAGSVQGTFDLSLNGSNATEKFDSAQPLVYQGFTINIDSVDPAPVQGTKDLTKYKISISIAQS